jgi:hypothetical protein
MPHISFRKSRKKLYSYSVGGIAILVAIVIAFSNSDRETEVVESKDASFGNKVRKSCV